jgi:hypothetical protein
MPRYTPETLDFLNKLHVGEVGIRQAPAHIKPDTDFSSNSFENTSDEEQSEMLEASSVDG